MQELQDEDTRSLLVDLDSSWWSLRAELDKYLHVAQEQVSAYRETVSTLSDYTSKCARGFSALQLSYSKLAAVERRAHDVLQQTWSDVVPLVGLLAAKAVDALAAAPETQGS